MHSIAISFLAAAATLATSVRAAPTANTANSANSNTVEARAAYYVCNNNGFRGDCSVDPCAISWCPDFKPFTYEPVGATNPPTPAPPVTPAPAAKSFYVCFNNGFRGDCSVDPCAISWCPDYKPYTYTPIDKRSDPTVCAPGTGFFQSCSNGFRGCCKSDACGQAGWCPDYKFGSYTPIGATTVPTTNPAPEVVAPAVVPGNNGVCPPNTGFYQVCGNGFKGCCKKDACGTKTGVCPA